MSVLLKGERKKYFSTPLLPMKNPGEGRGGRGKRSLLRS